MSRTVEELERIVAEQAATIEALRKEVAELKAVIAALLDQKSLTSHNSHKPPSSDGTGKTSGKKKKSGKKRGGQPGRKGKNRQLLPPEKVGHFEHIFPERCECCAAALVQTPCENPWRHQVAELPEIKPIVTEYQMHDVVCMGCGNETSAELPQEIACSSFGPKLCTTLALLTGVYHLSRRKAQTLVSDLFGVEISLGAISYAESRMAGALRFADEEAQEKVCLAQVKHTDGTGWAQAGQSLSLWVLCSTAVTVFRVLANGSADSIQSMFKSMRGFLVSDRATAINFWHIQMRQICWAHLLRKFIYFYERDDDRGKHGEVLLGYTRLLFDYWHDFKLGEYDRAEFRRRMAPLRMQLIDALEKAEASGLRELSGSCGDILDHKEALFNFVEQEGVQPTNNDAERALRPFVLWRKQSFGAQSDRGHRYAERIMTVCATARKQQIPVLDFLLRSYNAFVRNQPAPSLFASA